MISPILYPPLPPPPPYALDILALNTHRALNRLVYQQLHSHDGRDVHHSRRGSAEQSEETRIARYPDHRPRHRLSSNTPLPRVTTPPLAVQRREQRVSGLRRQAREHAGRQRAQDGDPDSTPTPTPSPRRPHQHVKRHELGHRVGNLLRQHGGKATSERPHSFLRYHARHPRAQPGRVVRVRHHANARGLEGGQGGGPDHLGSNRRRDEGAEDRGGGMSSSSSGSASDEEVREDRLEKLEKAKLRDEKRSCVYGVWLVL